MWRLPPFPVFLLFVSLSAVAAEEKPSPPKSKANRLAHETSPYLLQHAHNPVDWYPWSPEAFAKAKKENKLIFLSIGYSSCHWCHVMERESFSNAEVAKILNRDFICIKVDREERPDIDHIYMTALQVQRHSGGWPLSMFLLPDGKPLVGGTYWPREDREIEGEKVRGFKTLLGLVQKHWIDHAKDAVQQADSLAKATVEALDGGGLGTPVVELDRTLVNAAVEALTDKYDAQYGGFGSPSRRFLGPKFPTPPTLLFLFEEGKRTNKKEIKEMVYFTLDQMAQGGIYDQLGGGFHRYSTERTWTVPHFEKMLYDNAQLCEIYALAYAETKKPLYKRVLQQTLAFLQREMTSPGGAFYSALDADSEGEEGKFYVWTTREIDDVLADQPGSKLFKEVYAADEQPNFESAYYIFRLKSPLAQLAKTRKLSEEDLDAKLLPLRRKLLQARAKRPRPFLDTKVLTGWNGQMIAGAALAGQVLGDKEAIQTATKAAEFVLKNLRGADGRLLRSFGAAPGQKAEAKLNAYLDDYAYLVHGLLTLHDVTGNPHWLTEARALSDTMVKLYGERDKGGFFYTSNDHEKLFARAKDQYDGAQPSGNSMAARNLVRLWIKTKDASYQMQADKTMKSLVGALKSNPASLCTLADALGMYLHVKK